MSFRKMKNRMKQMLKKTEVNRGHEGVLWHESFRYNNRA